MQAPRQRTAEEEEARAAARQAERELWEKTRGAGSSVFKLVEDGVIVRRTRPRPALQSPTKRHQLLQSTVRRRSGDGRQGVPSRPASLALSESHSFSQDSNARAGTWSAGPSRQSDYFQTDVLPWSAEDIVPPLDEVEDNNAEPVEVPSADVLLSRGICEYTLLPKTLGRGKFSTVFLAIKDGEKWAIKHTALFPHHQLIATRLLREPTLLAELPPHPNLVVVKETIRTPGHFYLVEEYLEDYVTLEALLPIYSTANPPTLPIDSAERILVQLLSAVRAIHHPLQICHRDIKPENVLVHPKTLQLKLLDFGLATHYSRSEPKLSTCCGSPAYHCPEIVRSLASPPGAVTYMGPEVDAWTCGVTMLRCLTGVRFPLGPSHTSLRAMTIRAQRAVASISNPAMRAKIGALLDMDGRRRMQNFNALVVEQERELGEPTRGPKAFRSTSFVPTQPTHSIRLPILEGSKDDADSQTPASTSRRTTPSNSRPSSPSRSSPLALPSTFSTDTSFVAINPTHQPPERVISFVKYCLRCAGILYHTWADVSRASKGFDADSGLQSPTATRGVSAAFAEAAGMPLDAASTPWTPLFPPKVTPAEHRTDDFAHVQVFQCVLEIRDEEAVVDESSQAQPSLVQSLMAAFSRKLAPALGSPRIEESSSSQTRVAAPNARAGMGKRSMSTPAQARPEKSGPPSSSGSKDGSVRCLPFHLIIRFPKNASSPTTRQSAYRHSSFFGSSRDLSEGGSLTSAATALANGNHRSSVHENGQIDFNRPRAGKRNTQPNVLVRSESQLSEREGRKQVARVPSGLAGLPTDDNKDTEGEAASSESPMRAHERPAMPQPHSRVRKISQQGNGKRRAQIFFQVTDARALQAVKEALAPGGTLDAKPYAVSINDPVSRADTTSSVPATPRSVTKLSLAPSDHNRPTTPSGLSTELASKTSSPKEICLAIQERMEIIALAGISDESGDEVNEALEKSMNESGLEPSQANKGSQVVEMASLLQHLGMVLPRVKTQRPDRFIEPLVKLVPQSMRAAFEHDSSVAEATNERDVDPPTLVKQCSDLAASLQIFAQSLRKWIDSIDCDQIIVQHLLVSVSMAAVIALMPHLAKAPMRQTWAEQAFSRWKPQFAFSRPQDLEHDDVSQSMSTDDHKYSDRAWKALSALAGALDLNLEKVAFERPDPSKGSSDAPDAAVKSVGAFMLRVGSEVWQRRDEETTTTIAMTWSDSDARQRLLVALPLIAATLSNDRPATMSDTGNNALAGAQHLFDAVLTWTVWCVQNMGDATLDDDEATIIAHSLARHAALCSHPPARHISVELFRTLMESHVSASTARETLQDLILESQYPHLRVAVLGLTRSLIVSELAQLNGSTISGHTSRFATPELLRPLQKRVFSLAAPLPAIDRVGDTRIFLEDHGKWLSESLGFVYLVTARDVKNLTGIRDAETLQCIQSDLIEPLQGWIVGAAEASEGSQENNDVVVSLAMLDVALDRAATAVKDASCEQGP